MTRKIFIVLPFLSAIFFPWPLTAVLALGIAVFEPFVPLAVGLFADMLYYAPYSGAFPLFTLWGAAVTGIIFSVRRRVKTSIIQE